MQNYVFMLEEESMKLFIETLLPRFYPAIQFRCIAHMGKNDLEKSIPRKLAAWQDEDSRFIIIRDNDNAARGSIEKKIGDMCTKSGRFQDTITHIAYQELEAWYLGELAALERSYHVALPVNNRQKKFRTPDSLGSPSKEIKKLVPAFQKLDGAVRIAKTLTKDANCSDSYNAFLGIIENLA